jgi:hypothetical protein
VKKPSYNLEHHYVQNEDFKINLLGEYDFSDEKLQDSVGIKPPKLAA